VGNGGYVKSANLLSTMSIPWSKIIVRVGEGALGVYISNIKDLKGIGAMWNVGDMDLCRKQQMIIQ